MKRSETRILTTHTGSLPRPDGLVEMLGAVSRGEAVDDAHQVIVAAEATNQASDKNQAVSMIEQAIGNVGAVPKEVSADAGYYSAKAVDGLSALGTDPFVALDKTRHDQAIPLAPRGRIPANLSARDRMRRKLRTKQGRQRRAAQTDGGAGARADQAGARLPAVPAAGPGKGKP